MKKLTIPQAQKLAVQTGQKAPRTQRGIEGALVRELKNMDYHRSTERGIEAAKARVGAYSNCLREVFGLSEAEIEEVYQRAVI